MSFIQKTDIENMEKRYGKPAFLNTEISMSPAELEIVRNSQKDGRAHDITLFIFNDGKLLFNAKHFYPEGLFRAPSGGVNRDETIELGAKREAYEETGVEIELKRYLARIDVRFFNRENKNEQIDWTSYVFSAKFVSGEIAPQDTDEIREAKWIKPDEIPKFTEIMKNSERGGFHYRAFLTENVLPMIQEELG
jgi:ADP-ribose pyrophosphatase YjhB (NUDIX family)